MKAVFILFIFITSSSAICLKILTYKETWMSEENPGRLRKWNDKTHEFDLIEAMNANRTAICSVHFKYNMTNETVTASGLLLLPYLDVMDNGSVTGYIGDIWTTLENTLNFKTIFHPTDDPAGEKLLMSGSIQHWLSASAIATYPPGHFAYSLEIAENHFALFVLSEGSRVSKWWYTSIFSKGLWSLSCVFVIGITALIFGMYRLKRATCRNYIECNDELAISSFNFICVLGVMTGQGFQKIPTSWSLRFLVISALTMGMLISCAFSSTLTSYLAIMDNSLSFKNLNDITDKKTHSICVRRRTAASKHLYKMTDQGNSRDSGWTHLINKNCPQMLNTTDFVAKMCRPGYVYVETPNVFLRLYRRNHHRCRMAQVPGEHWSVKVGILHARISPHRRLIDQYLMRLRSAGILKYLEKKWISKEWPSTNDRQWDFKPVEYTHIYLISLALLTMMFVSGFICVLENIWYQFSLQQERNNRARLRLSRLQPAPINLAAAPPLDEMSKRAWITHMEDLKF